MSNNVIKGSVTIPGCLSATNFTQVLDVEEGFGLSAATAPSASSSAMPIVYFNHDINPIANKAMYLHNIDNLAKVCRMRLEKDPLGRGLLYIISESNMKHFLTHDCV